MGAEVLTSLWGYEIGDAVEVTIGDEVVAGEVMRIDAHRNHSGVSMSLAVWLDGCWMHHVHRCEDVRRRRRQESPDAD
ncbi:MAG: hypothetical protein AAFQ53_13085 [Bacteroidota bacterium]